MIQRMLNLRARGPEPERTVKEKNNRHYKILEQPANFSFNARAYSSKSRLLSQLLYQAVCRYEINSCQSPLSTGHLENWYKRPPIKMAKDQTRS